jgi:hypothetical protein
MFQKLKNNTMRKRKHLQTDFIKFILEKYAQDQDLPDEETETPMEDESKLKRAKRLVEFEDEEPKEDDETSDEEIIDELLNEYKRLKRQNENYRLLNRRKR